MGTRYISKSRDPDSSIEVQESAEYISLICKCISWDEHRVQVMDAGSCRCSAANQELRVVQKMYETRTASRNKRKVAELEAKVKEEEAQRTEENVAGEVDWIEDPGTPSKRATQYVRTKAESLRIKTLLSRALESKDKEKQHVVNEVNSAYQDSAEHYESRPPKAAAYHDGGAGERAD